jgi:formate-nitrite transporter family protein
MPHHVRANNTAVRSVLTTRSEGVRMKTEPHAKEHEAKDTTLPEGETIYRAVRQDGDHALSLSSQDLAWSGLAAGISMGFSFAAEGLLQSHLPSAKWTPLVSKFGYAVGFLIVVLGRQQLFTEQTLTAMLPLLSRDRPHGVLWNVTRMWAVVLAANLVGAAIFAAATVWAPVFPADVHTEFARIGHDAMAYGFSATLARAVFAGFLIATMIWLLPGAGPSRLWIVIIVAYVVGIGGFAHIIAGSTECFYALFTGQRSATDYVVNFLMPTFIGNATGGVALVAALAHAQHAPDESR